jgi:type IV pilus assembly protein PilV
MKERQQGFSLVEVMVAVVVICVGLLGIAKMQALSLSNSTTSRQRALAAIQAASLASAMHSNRQYWAGGAVAAAGFNLTLQGTPGNVVASDAALQNQLQTYLTAPVNLTACIATAAGAAAKCTATQLAAFDLSRWWFNSVNPLLPNAAATINCPLVPAGAPAPISCTVQITWTEKAIGVNNQGIVANTTYETPNYLLYVEP